MSASSRSRDDGDQALREEHFVSQGRVDVVASAGGAGVFARMIGLPAGTRIWIAAGVTDLRRGFTGLSGMVQTALQENPFSGHVFVFRGRRGDLIKMLWWDGDGLCLVREETGAREIHLAASDERNGGTDAGTAVDVARRDRLAAAGAQLRSADGGVKRKYFVRIFFTDFYFVHFYHAVKKVLAYCAQMTMRATLPDLDATRSRSTEGPDRCTQARNNSPHSKKKSFPTRAARFARCRDRALEAADRQAAAHAVRALVGEAGSSDRTTGAAAGRTAGEPGGKQSSTLLHNRSHANRLP